MRHRSRPATTLTCIALLAVGISCGPPENPQNTNRVDANPALADAGPQDWPDAYTGSYSALSGTVWAPGQAPGTVPNGEEIPVFNALVTVSNARQPPIPQETYCERCIDPNGKYVFTDHQGNFTMNNVVPGTYWVTIQKGQFRLERQYTLAPDQTLQMPAEATTLPSTHDPDNGMWIPRIAMAVGSYDQLQSILGKMGVGAVDGSGGFIDASAAGVMDIYDNGGFFSGPTQGTLTTLVSDLNRMLQYHVIFIPCSSAGNTGALLDQQNLRNIRDFVDAGGKLYVTDWSGEWADNVFPASVTLGPGEDTPGTAYDPQTDTWNTAQFGDADGGYYDSYNAEAVDPDLFEWLDGQVGPLPDNGGTVTFNAGNFEVVDNWNYIPTLNTIQVGVDNEGLPIFDTPVAYLVGDRGGQLPKLPLTVTYEPTGCGRVLYSTYHTTPGLHLGLVAQERVLLYLIMEIGVCQDGPIVD